MLRVGSGIRWWLPIVVAAMVVIGAMTGLTVTAMDRSAAAVSGQVDARAQDATRAAQAFARAQVGHLEQQVTGAAGRPDVREAVAAGAVQRENEPLTRALHELQSSTPGLVAAWVTDDNGTIMATDTGVAPTLGEDLSFRDWFLGARSSEQPYLSPGFVNKNTEQTKGFAVSVAVRGPGGPDAPLVGVLGTSMTLDAFHALLADAAPTGGSLVVTDQNSQVLASAANDQPQLSDRSDNPGVEAALAGRTSLLRTGGWVQVHAPLRGGWTVSTALPASLAETPNRQLGAAIATSGAVAGAGLLAALLLLGRVLRSRTRAQADARRHAGLLHAILDSIGDGVGVVDSSGEFLLHNRAAKDLLGLDDVPDPDTWQEHYGLFLPDGTTPFPTEELPLVRAMRGESTDGVDMVLRNPARPDGATISVTGRPLAAAAGVPGGAVAIFRDITERQHVLIDLARSEAAYSLAFEGALVGMSVTGLDGRFLRVNQAFADMLGRTVQDLVGRRAFEVNHPDEDPAVTLALVADVVAGRRDGFRLRKRFVRADGGVGHVEMSSVLVSDTDGSPLHFTNQVMDLTDRVNAELERDANQKMMRAIMDNSPSLILVKDLQGRYLLANTALQRITGRTEEQIIGLTNTDVVPHADPAWADRDVAARTGVQHDEEVAIRPDGTQVVYESVRFPLHDADGTLHGTCCISTDVTARRQATANKEAAAAAVAAVATETTQAKSRFLATMSHEIRTPLNGVLGLLTLLQDTDLDAQQRAWARAAAGSGRALLAIVNDVLDASKVDAGALTLERIELDVLAVIEEAAAPLRITAQDKGVHLLIAPARGLSRHRIGDPTRLGQIITNLVANAVKFTEHGTVTVVVAGSDRRVQLDISDTGIGMSPAQQAHLFTPYTQADASTTRRFGGTGLGLSIVAGLVEAMDGAITAASTVGVGSRFVVDLPLLAVAVTAPSPALPQPRRTDPGTPSPTLRVLVAEDDETNQMVAKALLRRHGMRVDIVSDGAAAVEAALGGGYDAVFMDCQMPGTDGLEATRQIRAHEAADNTGHHIPVIAMTASAFDSDRTACRDAGMDAFLPKPWTQEQLLNVLTRLHPAPEHTP